MSLFSFFFSFEGVSIPTLVRSQSGTPDWPGRPRCALRETLCIVSSGGRRGPAWAGAAAVPGG